MPVATKKRAPREAPIRGDKRPAVSERDELIFDYLMTHRVAAADDLFALFGGTDKTNFQERLRTLTAWNFLKRPAAQFNWRKAYRNPCVYSIGEEGIEHQKAAGDWRDPPRSHPLFFAHDLIASRVEGSLRIGAAKHGLRFISWQDITQNERFPEETLAAPKPWILPDVPIGGGETKDVEADTMPNGIARTSGDETIYFFTRGIEADGNTEPWNRYTSEGSSLYQKLVADLALARDRTCQKRFGIPNCYMPYVFCKEDRMHTIMRKFEELTEGKGSRNILFAHFPRFNDNTVPWPKPTGHMLEINWLRVGHPDFNFLTS
jgi:hypothetical protein